MTAGRREAAAVLVIPGRRKMAGEERQGKERKETARIRAADPRSLIDDSGKFFEQIGRAHV